MPNIEMVSPAGRIVVKEEQVTEYENRGYCILVGIVEASTQRAEDVFETESRV